MNRIRGSICRLVFLLALTSCDAGKELVSNLDSQQSVEVVVALNKAGIIADRDQRSSGRNSLYSVLVPKSDYSRALEILLEYKLPRERSKELEDLMVSSSLPSSEISSIRVNRALSLEIERLLSEMPGVVVVRALVRSSMPVKSFFEQKNQPSASVLIKFFSDQPSKIPFDRDNVIEIISNAVPGILPNEISLNLVKVEPPTSWLNSDNFSKRLRYVRPFAFRVPQEDLVRAKYQIIGVLLLICFAGFLLGGVSFLIWIRGRYKNATYSIEDSVLIESTNPSKDLPEK